MANEVPGTTPRTTLLRSELVLAVALLGLLVVFLVPLPTFILDILLAVNLSSTVLLLLVTLTVRKPLDFSTFPSLLLLLTLFRLGLNVATTRLILLQGNAGDIVQAFGQFVVGGNLIVGLVIFAILVIIQFVVITKGAGRVSEVAARFTLDAMPGKQMAIDAEMNAGLIDEPEARRRRSELMRESEFYGTMDGASRFVRGDAIAAIIITAVNLFGGFIIGLMNGQTLALSIKTYSILSIGDGLITQIPALITSVASGMLVTKTTSGNSLGQELSTQMTTSVAPLRLGSIILAGLGFVPGMPTLPFLLLGTGLFFAARAITQQLKLEQAKPATASSAATAANGAQTPSAPRTAMEGYVDDFLQMDRISLEVGAALVPMVNARRGSGLVERIGGLRRDLARQNGLWVPSVRVKDNMGIDPKGYRVLIGGREVARGDLRPELWLAIDPSTSSSLTVVGEPAREPAFGLPARWIQESDRSRAEVAGYTVVDAPSVLITHLGEVVRKHAHELLSREDLKALLDKVREVSPAVVDEVVPTIVSMGTLHRVLCLLLEERVPVSNLTRILESLATHATTVKDPSDLTERVRVDLGRAICDRFRDANGRIRAIVLDPRLEMELRRGAQGGQISLDMARSEQLMLRLMTEIKKAQMTGNDVPLLCDGSIRRAVRHTLARALDSLAVIAYQEIPTDVLMEPVAVIRPEELSGGTSNVSAVLAGGGPAA
jgi:flagellar biosynthesis protein FlhA